MKIGTMCILMLACIFVMVIMFVSAITTDIIFGILMSTILILLGGFYIIRIYKGLEELEEIR